MNQAEAAGRTIDEAVMAALEAVGAAREEVGIEVLQEPKPAILGFGGRDARVRVTRLSSPGALARDIAVETLKYMGYDVTAELAAESVDAASITLSGRELSGLIGRHGRTLDALEVLIGMHVLRRRGSRVALTFDAGGYRARCERALIEMARQASEQAVREGRPVALEPMEARERRIVHLALRDDPRVATTSQGEEGSRFVVVGLASQHRLPAAHPGDAAPEDATR